MKKLLTFLTFLLVAVAARAGDKVIYSWPSNATAANKVELAEDVTIEINGNTSKTVSGAKALTINGEKYTSMKVSNGAQNTLTLPKAAKAITFYSYVNKKAAEAADRDNYWSEVNGVSYDKEASGGVMTKFSDTDDALTNPDVRHYEFDEPTKTITFNNAGYQLCYVVEVEYEDDEEPVADPVYYLVGSMNEWTPGEAYKLEANPENEAEFMITMEFAAGAEFKVVKGEKEVWYPDGANYVVNEAGKYTVYFRPDGQGGSDWYSGVIYVTKYVEPVQKETFSGIFKTNAGWEKVYAYVWSGSNDENNLVEQLGEWPGKEISYNERYDQYEFSFEAETAPAFIIFNNGLEGDNKQQTEDQAFENQKIYEYTITLPEPIAAAFADGTYYLMNASTGKLAAANDLDKLGAPLAFAFAENKGYAITGSSLFAGKDWVAEGDGYYKFYTLVDGVKKYASVNAAEEFILADEANDAATWVLLTQEYWENEALSYNIAGTADLCGAEWDTNANKMTKNAETGLYEWKAENITVSNDVKPEFKVAVNNVADAENVETVAWYPGGDNWIINPDVTQGEGKFDITITFNVATKEINVAAVKAEEPVEPITAAFADGTYYLMNASTGKLAAANDLDKLGAPLAFAFTENKGYAITGSSLFADKDWVAEGDGYYKFYTLVDGVKKYASVNAAEEFILADEANDAATWVLLTQEYWENEALSYNIAGTADLCGAEWDTNANKMTKNAETGLYEWKAENITVSNDVKPEFKVAVNNVADAENVETVAWYPGGDNWIINPDVTQGEGKFDITITFNVATKEINVAAVKAEEPQPELNTYTATFTTTANWEKVYAYAWSGEGDAVVKFLGDWPGTELTKNAETGLYEVSIKAENAPANIIFNNGNGGEGNQTADLAFEDGKAYEYEAPIEVNPDDDVIAAPEGWTLAIANGNLAGEETDNYIVKDITQAQGPAVITPGVGKNNSRGIIVKSGDETEKEGAQAWDTQFFIKLNEAVPAGTKLHVEFDYKASQDAKATTQAHYTPGAYQHWAAIGDVNFTTEWQRFSADIDVNDAMAGTKTENGETTVGPGLMSIAFNLQEVLSATEYQFDNFGVWYQEPEVIDEWADIVVNGDMEGEGNECFYVTEQYVGGPYIGKITEGIGKDGSKAIKVLSGDDPTQDWDSQFFIRLPYQLPAGTQYRVSFDYKADKAGDFDTQSHAEPGQYIHWAAIGSGSFTTEWKTYKAEGTVPAECDGSQGNGFLKIFQSIAFNLAKNKAETEFIFDNVKFEIPANVLETLTKIPLQITTPYPEKPEINSMAIVGEFIGGVPTDEEAEPWWNPANGWAMEQSAEDPDVWTLTKVITTEAKTYEYKAIANGKWGDYELPANGNQSYEFTADGEYNLVFTVNTKKNTLKLDVEEVGMQDFAATFTTNAEWGAVYAYTWTDATDNTPKIEQLGPWPGAKLDKNDLTGGYDVNIRAKEAPAMIIFNNGYTGTGNQTEDLVFENGKAYEFTIEVGTETEEKIAPEGWTMAITNGNLAGDDASSFVMKEYPSTEIVAAAIEAGVGTNRSRGIVVKAGDDTANEGAQAWDSQFWIQLAEAVPAGTKLHVEFDYKASQAAKATTQAHNTPGAYQHWGMIGDVNFTTEWQTFSADVVVDDAMAGSKVTDGVVTEVGPGLLTIAFNLQEEKSATDYFFDNFGVWYEKPVEVKTMAIVGDFLSLEPTDEDTNPNWNPANGLPMEQDAENPAIWTLTVPFTAEAKTYEYKATANGKWGDYELPAEGNQNFTFGTDEYPAGDYNLTFTANTESNTLDLVVKSASLKNYTATFTTNRPWNKVYAYAWTTVGEGDEAEVTEFLGGWPGVELTADANDVYAVKIESEAAPAMIVFSNGNDEQTEDLAIEDGKAYEFMFKPTFDFENNNGQWAANLVIDKENTIAMDGITLSGETGKVTFLGDKLRVGVSNSVKGSFKLTAPEGKNIVKVELKVLQLPSDKMDVTTEVGDLAKTYEKTTVSGEDVSVDYAVLTWTGLVSDLTWTVTAKTRNIGYINVILEDAPEGIIPDGTYYAMSANEGTLINAEGALDAKGTPITFAFDAATESYAITGADFFADKQWTIAEAVEGVSGYYTISTSEGFLAGSATNTLEQIADGTSEAAVWVLLEKAYWEDIVNSTYTIAGTKNLTGTENDWEVAEANQMVLNAETGLFEKTFKRIAIDGENQPEFKVVQTNMEGESTWYPASEEGNDHNWVITTDFVGGEGLYDITITFDPSDYKEIAVSAKERIVFPEDAIVYDFELAADAGENPENKNGSAANGQAFYGWENAEKTDSKRQDYKGYEGAEGNVLPKECHVWRRSDRINGNVVNNGGLKCPSNKEMAIDGLNPGDKVIIVYDAENATDKEIIWAIGDGSSDETLEGPRATATINGVEAVTGETTIASGAEIIVNSVTPAENGSGYIVFQVKKGMIIKQIAVIPAPAAPTVDELYVMGNGTAGEWNTTTEMTFNETTQAFEYDITANGDTYFTFGDTEFTGDWNDWNANHRYAIAAGDQEAVTGTEYELVKIEGTIKINATGTLHVSVTKDLKMTLSLSTITDGIASIKAAQLEGATVYTLQGVRVNNVKKGGMYIINGRKVAVK